MVRIRPSALPTSHTEHRGWADADGIEPVSLGVVVSDMFVEQLARAIHRVWRWWVVLAEFWTSKGLTHRKYGHGTHVDYPRDTGKPGRFEDIGRANAVDIDRWQRIAHSARAKEIGQMNDTLDVVLLDRVEQRGDFHHISLHHLHLCSHVGNRCHIGNRIEQDQILFARLQQMPGQMPSEKPCAAGNENRHRKSLLLLAPYHREVLLDS